MDNGLRSGHGLVAHLFYDQCEKIWGGSPAAEQIPAGIESSEVRPVEVDAEDSDSQPIDDEPNEPGFATSVTSPPGTSTPATPTTTVDREDLSVRRNTDTKN